LAGVLWEIESPNKKKTKFEQLMNELEYYEHKLMESLPIVDFEVSYVGARGNLFAVRLFDLTYTRRVSELVVEPLLEQYRSNRPFE
jgi:hypothetical protein